MPWVQHVTPEIEAISQYRTILWVCGSLTLFMLLVVALRTYVRIARVKNFGIDDTLVLGGAVSSHSFLSSGIETTLADARTSSLSSTP
jgi:hypothetical protein